MSIFFSLFYFYSIHMIPFCTNFDTQPKIYSFTSIYIIYIIVRKHYHCQFFNFNNYFSHFDNNFVFSKQKISFQFQKSTLINKYNTNTISTTTKQQPSLLNLHHVATTTTNQLLLSTTTTTPSTTNHYHYCSYY